MRRLAAALLFVTVSGAALGQETAATDVQVPPVDVLATGDPTSQPAEDANSISDAIFGNGPPAGDVDDAYGAFQRGYYLTALELALPRASAGDAAAQTLIAEIYAKGLGVPEDAAKAASWYTLASKNGDPLATLSLAMMYEEGVGVERDPKRAAALFETAADAGNLAAKYNLGLLYIEGSDVQPDLVKAAALIKQAADGGLAEAQYDYGSMLMEGAGVAPNPAEGARQIGLAAAQGQADAEIDYATLLYLGKGVTRDLDAAVKLYRRAAGEGNPVAQNRYAKLLAAGEGVSLDLGEAAMWRALARRQGLTDPALDDLLVSIPADELAHAEERARYWPAEPPSGGPPATAQADAPIPTVDPAQNP